MSVRRLLVAAGFAGLLGVIPLGARALPSGLIVYNWNQYTNITTGTTTVVKAAPGLLSEININTPVAGETITVYDNTAASGTKIATITIPATITSLSPVTLEFNVSCGTGITVVTSSTADITVSWR